MLFNRSGFVTTYLLPTIPMMIGFNTFKKRRNVSIILSARAKWAWMRWPSWIQNFVFMELNDFALWTLQ